MKLKVFAENSQQFFLKSKIPMTLAISENLLINIILQKWLQVFLTTDFPEKSDFNLTKQTCFLPLPMVDLIQFKDTLGHGQNKTQKNPQNTKKDVTLIVLVKYMLTLESQFLTVNFVNQVFFHFHNGGIFSGKNRLTSLTP